jgi:hypothetical protein
MKISFRNSNFISTGAVAGPLLSLRMPRRIHTRAAHELYAPKKGFVLIPDKYVKAVGFLSFGVKGQPYGNFRPL